MTHSERKTITLSAKTWEAVRAYRHQHRHPTLKAAVEELLGTGLRTTPHVEVSAPRSYQRLAGDCENPIALTPEQLLVWATYKANQQRVVAEEKQDESWPNGCQDAVACAAFRECRSISCPYRGQEIGDTIARHQRTNEYRKELETLNERWNLNQNYPGAITFIECRRKIVIEKLKILESETS